MLSHDLLKMSNIGNGSERGGEALRNEAAQTHTFLPSYSVTTFRVPISDVLGIDNSILRKIYPIPWGYRRARIDLMTMGF